MRAENPHERAGVLSCESDWPRKATFRGRRSPPLARIPRQFWRRPVSRPRRKIPIPPGFAASLPPEATDNPHPRRGEIFLVVCRASSGLRAAAGRPDHRNSACDNSGEGAVTSLLIGTKHPESLAKSAFSVRHAESTYLHIHRKPFTGSNLRCRLTACGLVGRR